MTICRKCGNEFEQSAAQAKHYDYRCRPCGRAYVKAWAIAHPRTTEYVREYYHKATKINPVAVLKHSARAKLRHAVNTGKLQRLPCEICGDLNTHGHHDDYSKPLDVRWLCHPHHAAFHRGELQS